MTCRELNEFLDEYIDGVLALENRRRFEAHLRACPKCVAYLRSYEGAIRAARLAGVAAAPAADPPEDLVRAVLVARSQATRATPTPEPTERERRGRRPPTGGTVA